MSALCEIEENNTVVKPSKKRRKKSVRKISPKSFIRNNIFDQNYLVQKKRKKVAEQENQDSAQSETSQRANRVLTEENAKSSSATTTISATIEDKELNKEWLGTKFGEITQKRQQAVPITAARAM